MNDITNKIASMFSLDKDYGQSLENDYIYAKNNIETTNIFLNSKSVFIIILQAAFSWAILYSLRAKFISLPAKINSIEEDSTKE